MADDYKILGPSFLKLVTYFVAWKLQGAVLTEMLRSGKASKKMLNVHYAAMGLAVLSIVRGLLPPSAAATPTSGKGTTKRTAPQKKMM